MTDGHLKICATDKEMFDVYMANKRKFTETALLGAAKRRGIFCSVNETRETLASYLSTLNYGYKEVCAVLDHGDHAARKERVTHISLPAKISLDEIKEVVAKYQGEAADERVNSQQRGSDSLLMTVQYTEIDYRKNRLLQRSEKEADIEISVQENQTIIRLPANDRARQIADNLRLRLEADLRQPIPSIQIELTEFAGPELRTEFFTTLISTMDGFDYSTVTNVKVENMSGMRTGSSDFDDEFDHENAEMLGLVKEVDFKGPSLLHSEVYQQLVEKGFFVTSIVWRATQRIPPHAMVEFEASFENSMEAKGFKYLVRGVAQRQKKGGHAKTFALPTDHDKGMWLDVIEATAHRVVQELRSRPIPSPSASAEDEE